MRKWWNRLVDFMKELATHRGHVLQGMEEDLFEALAVLHPVLNLVRQLYLNPAAELTQDDWELVYMQTTWANQKVRLVLADGEEEDGCEILAQELNGMSSQVLLLITPNLEFWTSGMPLDLYHTDFQLEEHEHLDLNLVWLLDVHGQFALCSGSTY